MTTDASSKQKNKTKSEKKARNSQSPAVDKLKIVVRRLPPNLPEDVFWQSVQPWVTGETVSWRAFYPGKIRKKYNIDKGNIPSRAYIAFRTVEQVATFGQAYDGHVFRDKAGNESFAVVEFAPFQKVPPEKRKVDTRLGTIEQDEDYKSFLASLNAPTSKPSETETIEALIAASQPPEQPKTTPLLDALRAEKQAQRDKETILKAHAHYRDRAKEDHKKGKQPKPVPPNAREDAPPVPGQGKRNKRGKKGDTAGGAVAPKTKGNAPPPGPSVKAIAKLPEKAGPQLEPGASSKDETKEPQRERRHRAGLGSRQFEAALAGAGVLPGGSSDRKSRREREREKKANEPIVDQDSQKAMDKGKEKADKLSLPPSPGKERSRGGRKRGDSSKGQPVPTNTVASKVGAEEKSEVVPTILPRASKPPIILTRPAPASEAPDVATAGGGERQVAAIPTPGEGRGGRRRGRGRGASRGGMPT